MFILVIVACVSAAAAAATVPGLVILAALQDRFERDVQRCYKKLSEALSDDPFLSVFMSGFSEQSVRLDIRQLLIAAEAAAAEAAAAAARRGGWLGSDGSSGPEQPHSSQVLSGDGVERPWKRQAVEAAGGAAAGGSAAAAGAEGVVPRHIQAAGREWLQQLALLLPLADPPAEMCMGVVKKQLPIPPAVVQHFGTVSKFLRSMPGLHCRYKGQGFVSLDPAFHRSLKREAEAAAGRLPQQLQAQVRGWLRQLARLLPPVPTGAIESLRGLRTVLPVPDPVWRHFGSVSAFVGGTPGLSWVGQYDFRLDPALHAELLQEVGP
jgi:hypothetical protein